MAYQVIKNTQSGAKDKEDGDLKVFLNRRPRSARPRAGRRQGRERGGASLGSSAPSGPSPRCSAAAALHPSAVPALTSGREGAGWGGCWGAASCLPTRLSDGQRQQGRPRGRCSWLVAHGALRPRPRRRLPPSPLRGLRAGTQLTPQPRSPPPLRLPGRRRSRLQRRPTRRPASGSQRRPAPGPGVAAAARQPARRSQPRCDAGRCARELPPLQRPPRAWDRRRRGLPPAARDFLQDEGKTLPPLSGGAAPASEMPTWRPRPGESAASNTSPPHP
ncbi:serine/arginine repetitive matrix protein 2-like [Equus asinus]|uniref:serine/arginine repetitive matrix protein 2-like n=1 Tax=Equus asinus TaxID=9793 RepID=UPI0038F5F156